MVPPGVAVLWCLWALAGAWAADGAFPYPVASRTLDNGLVVHAVRTPSEGVVAYYTWMAVGSRDELDPGFTGFAHFFEHLLFAGGQRWTPEERERLLLRMGATGNAWTGPDETVYHLVAPAGALPDLVAMEADHFEHLELTAVRVRTEAGAVAGELRKMQSDPRTLLSFAAADLAYDAHTYGHEPIGYEADIRAMPGAWEYAKAFHDRLYRPENATILVVGDVDPQATLDLVAQAYGGWARGTASRRVPPVEPPQAGIRRRQVDWPTPTAPLLELAWKVPGFDPATPDAARMALLADWLLAPNGALQRRLVREEPLAYDVSGGADQSLDPGLLRIDVTARSAGDLPRIEAIVREEIAALQRVDPAALARTQAHGWSAFVTGLAEPAAVADALGRSLRRNPDPAALDRFWADWLAATPADLARAASAWLTDDRLSVVTLVGPAEAK